MWLHIFQMDELACFAPGMLALGSSGYGPDESQKLMSLAEEVFLWLTPFILLCCVLSLYEACQTCLKFEDI